MTHTERTPKKARRRNRPATANPKGPAGLIAQASSDATKARALVEFRKHGTVTAACEAAQVARRTWYDWIESDEAFAHAVMDANESVTEDLEREAIKRAKDGSDVLIIFLLKSKRPERYRDRVSIEQVRQVDPEVRARIRWQWEILRTQATWTMAGLLEALSPVWSTGSTVPAQYLNAETK